LCLCAFSKVPLNWYFQLLVRTLTVHPILMSLLPSHSEDSITIAVQVDEAR
jgi:hypothetical protein